MKGKGIHDLFERMEDVGDSAFRETAVKKRLINTGVDIRQDTPEELTFQHSVLCQTAMPAKRPEDGVRR